MRVQRDWQLAGQRIVERNAGNAQIDQMGMWLEHDRQVCGPVLRIRIARAYPKGVRGSKRHIRHIGGLPLRLCILDRRHAAVLLASTQTQSAEQEQEQKYRHARKKTILMETFTLIILCNVVQGIKS